ncbi:hypothetical protein ABZ260_25760 [Streptosporangium sp. NPDC006013]|uniref:hypothetical protein n=1 Tax=Streptosporangium sp. NPDC006013 TaxID=3155596 RepID=UPI0033AD50CE
MSLRFAGVPAAPLFAGLVVPALGTTVGWGWAFVPAALAPLGGPAVLAGSVLGFGLDRGWTGQSLFLAVRAHLANPDAVASVVQSGGMSGTAEGPLVGAVAVYFAGLLPLFRPPFRTPEENRP